MHDLRLYFQTFDRFRDPSANPYFLSHIVCLGAITNELVLPRSIDSGLYVPSTNWKQRGELAVATFGIYLNLMYNEMTNCEPTPALKFLFHRSLITLCSQFWTKPEFGEIKASHCLNHFDQLFPISNKFRDNVRLMATHIGLAGVDLENDHTDFMIRFSGYLLGLCEEIFGRDLLK